MNRHPSDRLRQAMQIVSGVAGIVEPETAKLLERAVELTREVAVELEGEDLADLLRDPDGVMAAASKRMGRAS